MCLPCIPIPGGVHGFHFYYSQSQLYKLAQLSTRYTLKDTAFRKTGVNIK